jgi:O-antigen/teichoic acid export membrane protein
LRTILYKWIKTNGVMLFNAASFVGTFIVKAGFGFAFWWIAARQFAPESVGFASAAISAMTLLGTFCMLGLGTLLIRELPRQPGKAVSLISSSLILVGIVGASSGLLFALGSPSLSHDLQPLRASPQAVILFAAGVSFTAVGMVLDQALFGFLRGDLQLWRNTLFAGAKLAALTLASVWLAQRAGLTIYTTWLIGDALSSAALAVFTVSKGKWNGRIPRPQLGLLRELGPSAIQHHLLNLLMMGPNMALPVLVTILISATMNAWFYVAFLLADIVYVIPQALVTALYAVSSAQPEVLAHKARLTLSLAVITCVVANCVLFFGSRQLLGLFGPGYVAQGVWSMRILGLAAIPFFIKDHYISICRIQDHMAQALLPLTAGALLELAASALGARLGGITGLSLGWLIAVCIEALFMSRRVYKTIRPTSVSQQEVQDISHQHQMNESVPNYS